MSIRSIIDSNGADFQIFRKSGRTASETGSVISGEDVLHKELRGWLQPVPWRAARMYESRTIKPTGSIYVYKDPEFREGDHCTYEGVNYLILAVQDQAGVRRCWRLDVTGDGI